ncbi:ABC transporter ATP-binding protein [Agrococcus jenensis]|uniref:Heme exporter protein A n=1 Tax=Agrococcus jenensis TaxID=46353 RepID=A0A3N2ASL8_9MICO|nr:ATP-binding cassette domain-containing protein [Agrococcus jenensis]ROR66047.1 heme exporter protein A [Agrococcus jenensis]
MAIEVRGVGAVRRGRRAVPVPDLSLGGPGLVRVRGANGAGKSTLIELLAGGIAPAVGEVRICGVRADARAARGLRRVCRTEIALLGHVALRRHATLFARAAAVPALEALGALADEGLADRLDDRVDALSTGEARRAWMRLTTLGAAPVLLLDEPLLGVDEAAAEALRERIDAWAVERLVVVVDHGRRDWGGRALDLSQPRARISP